MAAGRGGGRCYIARMSQTAQSPARARMLFIDLEGSDATLQQAISTFVASMGGPPHVTHILPAAAPAALPAAAGSAVFAYGSPATTMVEVASTPAPAPTHRPIPPRPEPAKKLGRAGRGRSYSDEDLVAKARNYLKPGESCSPTDLFGNNFYLRNRATKLLLGTGEFTIAGDKRKTIHRLSAPGPAPESVAQHVARPSIDINDPQCLLDVTGAIAESWDDLPATTRGAVEAEILRLAEGTTPHVDSQADLQALFSIGYVRRQARDLLGKHPKFRLLNGGQTVERIAV